MNDNTITLYALAWGNYWERYGGQWLNRVNKLNTEPDQLFVVTDRELHINIDQIVVNEISQSHPINVFRQIAINNAECDWVVHSDIDDHMLPNFLDNLNKDCDVHNFSYQFINSKMIVDRADLIKTYKDCFKLDKWTSLACSQSAVKRKAIQSIDIGKYGWEDILLYLKLCHKGYEFYYDPTIRFLKNDYESSLQHINSKVKDRETQKVFEQLKNENI